MQADPAERTPVRPGLRHLSGHTDSVRGHVLRLSLPVQLPLPGRPPPLDPSGASGARDAGGHPRARPTAAVPPELCQRPPSSRQAEVLRRADHSGHGAADCGPPVFGETLLLGSLAILAGIALGAFLSQLASFAVFRAFGESYRLQPGLFPDTLAQTLLFFGGIFLVVGLRNLVLVRRLPVLSMLQADRKTESFPSAPRCGDGFPLFSWSPPPPED